MIFSSFPPRAGIGTLSKDLLRLDAGYICTYSLMWYESHLYGSKTTKSVSLHNGFSGQLLW